MLREDVSTTVKAAATNCMLGHTLASKNRKPHPEKQHMCHRVYHTNVYNMTSLFLWILLRKSLFKHQASALPATGNGVTSSDHDAQQFNVCDVNVQKKLKQSSLKTERKAS